MATAIRLRQTLLPKRARRTGALKSPWHLRAAKMIHPLRPHSFGKSRLPNTRPAVAGRRAFLYAARGIQHSWTEERRQSTHPAFLSAMLDDCCGGMKGGSRRVG